MKLARVAALLGAWLAPASLVGQICMGRPSLATTSGNVGLGTSFFNGGRSVSADVTVGGQLFVSASVSYYDYVNSELSLKSISGLAAYEVANASSVRICPGFQVSYAFGLETLGYDVTTLTLGPLVSVGYEARLSPTVGVAPFATAAVLIQEVDVVGGTLDDGSASDTHGALIVGVGLLFSQMITVGPFVDIPLARKDGDASLGVSASIGFRRD
jgi:hypothetical protein